MSITEFLLARIAEDEAVARKTLNEGSDLLDWSEPGDPAVGLAGPVDGPSGYESIVIDPARVLAECEAKRRIVEAHAPVDNDPDGWCTVCDGDGWPCVTMSALASVYADHPDFDPAWRAE